MVEGVSKKKDKIAKRMVGQEISRRVRVGDEITGPGHPNWSKGKRFDVIKK